MFRSTSLGEGYAASLVRQDGTLLARFPRAGTIGMKATVTVFPRPAAARAAASRAISPVDHQTRIAAAYRLLDYPVAVITTQTDATAFATWRNTALTMGVVALLLIAAVLVGATLLARSWRQQERLTAARNAVIEADKSRLLAEAELHRQRDITEQSERFNAAVENMSQGLCMFDDRELPCRMQSALCPNVHAAGATASAGNAARSNRCLLRPNEHSRPRMR